MTQPLIINADDFGLTDGVCQAIVELGQNGGVSSTTAMLGVPEALPRIHRYWEKLTIPCGVHLHVTYGFPISKSMQQYCASRWEGNFPRSRPEIDFPLDILLEECRAQLDLFITEFGRPSHFDTHHGFHRDSRYREGLLKLAKEYSLPTRGGRDGETPTAASLGVIETNVIESWSNAGWDTVEDGLLKLKEVFVQAKTNNLGGVWELVCHPGYTDDHLRAVTTLNDRRELEKAILSSPEGREVLTQQGLVLTDFRSFK